jgi:DNA-binding MarR family transcriptional regulator
VAKLVLDDFLPYRLSVAANAVSQVIARSYEAPAGLKTNEWRVIAALAEDDELSQQALVGRVRMDKVTVSRAAQALEGRGLLRRTPDPGDGRSLVLSLTPAGRRLHMRLAPAAVALEAELLADLAPADVARLHKLLRQLEEAAERALTR